MYYNISAPKRYFLFPLWFLFSLLFGLSRGLRWNLGWFWARSLLWSAQFWNVLSNKNFGFGSKSHFDNIQSAASKTYRHIFRLNQFWKKYLLNPPLGLIINRTNFWRYRQCIFICYAGYGFCCLVSGIRAKCSIGYLCRKWFQKVFWSLTFKLSE